MLFTGTMISSYQTISTVTFKYHGSNVPYHFYRHKCTIYIRENNTMYYTNTSTCNIIIICNNPIKCKILLNTHKLFF